MRGQLLGCQLQRRPREGHAGLQLLPMHDLQSEGWVRLRCRQQLHGKPRFQVVCWLTLTALRGRRALQVWSDLGTAQRAMQNDQHVLQHSCQDQVQRIMLP